MDGDASPDGAFEPDGSHSPGGLGGDFPIDLEFWPDTLDHSFPMANMWPSHVDDGNLHAPPVPPQSMFAQQPHYGSETAQHALPGIPRKSEVRQNQLGLGTHGPTGPCLGLCVIWI